PYGLEWLQVDRQAVDVRLYWAAQQIPEAQRRNPRRRDARTPRRRNYPSQRGAECPGTPNRQAGRVRPPPAVASSSRPAEKAGRPDGGRTVATEHVPAVPRGRRVAAGPPRHDGQLAGLREPAGVASPRPCRHRVRRRLAPPPSTP